MKLLQVDQSRGGGGRRSSSDVQEGPRPQAQPTAPSTPAPSPATTPTPDARGTEARHADASARLSGAGRDLTGVTGRTTTPSSGPSTDPREQFRQELEHFESLRRANPIEAMGLLPNLRRLAGEIRENLRSTVGGMAEDLLLLRRFDRSALDFLNAHRPTDPVLPIEAHLGGDPRAAMDAFNTQVREFQGNLNAVNGALGTLRTSLRNSLAVPSGGWATADQRDTARVVIEISRGLSEPAEVIADYRRHLQLINNTSGRDLEGRARVEELARDVRELFELRAHGLDGQPLSSTQQDQISTLMRDYAVEIHNAASYIQTPRAQDCIDQFLRDVIDSNDGELVLRLSGEGLEAFASEREGPRALFERRVRRLESRIQGVHVYESQSAQDELHGILQDIHQLESNIDSAHVVEDLLTLRGLYQQLTQLESHPQVRDCAAYSEVRPGLERLTASLRATREIFRNGLTGDYPAQDRIHMAQLATQISRGLGETGELIADHRRYLTVLNTTSSRDLEGAARVDAYAGFIRDLVNLRTNGLNQHLLTSAEESQVNSLMRDAATELHNSLGYLEIPHAHESIDRLLNRIIDSDDQTLVLRLTANGLQEYAQGMHRANEALTQARGLQNPAQRRTALAEALRQFVALGASDQIHEVTNLILNSVPANASDAARLQVYTVVSSVLHGSHQPDEARVRELGRTVAQRLMAIEIEVEHVEYDDVADGPGGSHRAVETSRTMVNPRGHIETAEGLLAARSFFAAIGENATARQTEERLEDLQDRMSTQIRTTTDHRLRIELAAAIVGLDQTLADGQIATAEDADDRHEVGTRIRGHLQQWQNEIQSARDLPADFRFDQIRSILGAAAAYRPLTQGDRAALNPSELDDINTWASSQLTSVAQTTIGTYGQTHQLDPQLTPRVVEDFRARVDRAVREGDSAWLNGLNEQAIGQFTELSQSAHVLLQGQHQPRTAEDLQHCLEASAIFGRLGLPERVRECLRPVLSHADGLRDSSSRAHLYFNLGQIYQEAGMTEDANGMLEHIRDLNGPHAPREIRQLAEVVPAMQELNLGHLDRARDLLREIHGNPRAVGLLSGIEGGLRRRRAMQSLDMARAVVHDYIAASRDRGSTTADRSEREIIAVFERAQRLVLSGRYGSIDEALRHLNLPLAASEFFTESSAGSSLRSFLEHTADVSLTDDAFSERAYGLARRLFHEQRFQSSGQIANMLTGSPNVRARAQSLIDSIPAEARWQSIFSITNVPIVGSILLNTGGERAVGMGLLRDVATLVTFGAARGLAVGAEAMFAAYVTESAVASSLMLQTAGFLIRSGTEAAVFTLSNMAFETLFTGRTDHWTLANFGRQFGSMLVTFAFCHGINLAVSGAGRLAARTSWMGMAAEGVEGGATRVLTPGAQAVFGVVGYGATISGLAGVEYLNEALGLHPHEGDVPFVTRLLGSALMDAQMRLAGHVVNAATGGAVERMEQTTQQRYLINELMPVVERMGFARPERTSDMSPEARIVLQTLMARVAAGESVSSLTERARSSEADLSRTVQMIFDVPPETPEGRRLRALLFAYSQARGPEFSVGGERLSEEVGRLRIEMGRTLRGLGVPEGPEFNRLQGALLERVLGARVWDSRGRPRPFSVADAEALTRQAAQIRGPLEEVVREVIGQTGLESREGRALVGDLYTWMLETGGTIDDARAEAIRRRSVELARTGERPASPTVEASMRQVVAQAQQLAVELGSISDPNSPEMVDRVYRPLLRRLFTDPASPPTTEQIRTAFAEIRNTLSQVRERLNGLEMPVAERSALLSDIFSDVTAGRMTREQALSRVAEAASERSDVRRRSAAGREGIPLAARDGSADVRGPHIPDLTQHAVPEPPSVGGSGRLQDGALHVDFGGRSYGEVRIDERTLIFHGADGRVRLFNFTGEPLRIRRADGNTSEPISPARGPRGEEAGVAPGSAELRTGDVILFADGTEIPYGGATVADTIRRATSVTPDAPRDGRSEAGTVNLRRPASGSEGSPSEAGTVNIRGPQRTPTSADTEPTSPLVDGRLQLDFRDHLYQTVSLDGATLTFGLRGSSTQLYNFTGAEIRVRRADGTLSDPVAPPRARAGQDPSPPGSIELRAGDVIILAGGREVPVGEPLTPRGERATVRPPAPVLAEAPSAPVVPLEGRGRGRGRTSSPPEALPLAAAGEGGRPSVRPPYQEVTGVGPLPSPPELFGLTPGTEPQFLGYGIPQRMREGLFRLITPAAEETPFVNFAEEGLRVALEGRNARREVPGFSDFGHIVDRHAHASTARGDLRAGIYGENVDLETVGRETVRGWDQATISFDEQGRQIFILRRTYDAEIGVDSAGRPTRVNQVIVSRDGEIISSFPVPAEARGFVARSEITSEASFRDRLVQTSTSREVSERHAPFLSTSPQADRAHLYTSDTIPFGLVNQRTLATFRESQSPEYAGRLTTVQAGRDYDLGDGTTVIDRQGTRGRVLVAEMRFEDPIGVRETTGPDGSVQHTPLRWNRTYFVEREVRSRDGTVRTERTILGGYPIADPSEPHLPDTVWNPLARPRTEAAREAQGQGGRGQGQRGGDRRGGRPAQSPHAPQAADQPLATGPGEVSQGTVRPPEQGATGSEGPPPPEGEGGRRETTGVGPPPRPIQGGAGGQDLGIMAFTSPTPGVYTCTIGRWPSSTEGFLGLVESPHTSAISRRHAEVRIEGGRVTLSDLGGPNGTRVWDATTRQWRRLAAGERYSLQEGETFQLGTVTFFMEQARDGNYRLRVHGEDRPIAAAPFRSGGSPPLASRGGPDVVPRRVEASPSTLHVSLDFSRGPVVVGSFRGRDVPAGGIQISDRRISREHAVLNPGPEGQVVIEARPDTNPAVLRGDRHVTPVWVRQGDRWVMLGSAEHPERTHSLRPGESFALGTDPNPRVERRGRSEPGGDDPMIFTLGPDGRSISSSSDFTDRSAGPTPSLAPPPSSSARPPGRFVASALGEGGRVGPVRVEGDPFAELATLPRGTEVFIAARDGRIVVESQMSPESLIAVRLDGRGQYRVRGTNRALGEVVLFQISEGGATRSEPVVGHAGVVLRPGQNQIGVGPHFLNFVLPGEGSGPPQERGPAPLPRTGPIGRGTWSVELPDAPQGTPRSGLRLNDLAEAVGFLDFYMGDPATHPTATDPGFAQLTLADPLDTEGGGGERRPLGRLERTEAGWVLHPRRGREITISRPDRANPNGPSTEIRVTREAPQRLREGDLIHFGPALEFEFRNGSLVPAVTGDLRGRLSVPNQSAGGGRGGADLYLPSESLPPPPAQPATPPMIRDAVGWTMTVPLTQPGMLVLGRAGDLRIGDQDPASSVSARHATVRLVVEGGISRYEIRDGAQIPTGWQASLNGTFVNGERIRSGEWRPLREGDQIRIGTVDFTWHPPQTAASPDMHGTINFAQWQQMNPELFQARQFLVSSYLDGAPADRLEIPGRSAVYMEGAGRFVEGAESGGREIIVWDRSRDTEVSGFLETVEGEVRTRLGIGRLDPASPTFEQDLGRALDYFVGRLRETYRIPGESSRAAQARLDAFTLAHQGQPVLVGEVLRARLPFCRHLTLITQAFLTDLGLRGEAVRMQRGTAGGVMGGAHVWNEVMVGGVRRIVEPTWAFYGSGPSSVLLPPGSEVIYERETRSGRVEQ